MELSFKGKRAVVTGASRGIGNFIARELSKYGATVIAVARTTTELEKLKNEVPNVIPVSVDLSNWEATKAALSNVGPIDLLVNNAAIAILEPVGEINPETFDKTFATNVKAAINVSQICVKSMKERNVAGAIVNISSQAGIAALADHAVYSASKAALDQLTRVMALELGSYKIRVNSVNPTVTNTPMSMVGWSDPNKAGAMKAKIPLGRFAEPQEVSDAVLYLLSDRSSMITGTILPVDGGFTAC
ncbi:L-xylulose reductase [Ixodes scapularis]|uniref:Reductase, putative n=1 Tax=Ixodes scapularis TaxID=6945 RepID=B7Q1L6_IXOSC|nr:L-xylulose reductase [Ixodes scapularis]XP_040076482.1 L-xylulose reductase [Ixodes scapularis]EEC12752.1 reductase, putative [Ixodes scapularis]|eukprot:XP_002409851.1 reductase, putative [Ixodes scapularis]